MSTHPITSDPAFLWGTPQIGDSGLTVAHVVSLRRAGYSDRRILDACPRLRAADLEAAFEWHANVGDGALGPRPPLPGAEHPRIAVEPGIQGGVPVIRGTRITVDALCGLREAGCETAEILEEYPDITAEDVSAAFAYDAEVKGR